MLRMRYAELLNCLYATPGCNPLTGAARRARREAAMRRLARAQAQEPPRTDDPDAAFDPTRFGDWETNGLCRDF